MSEWGGYLKRAVANVEQRLDQALDSPRSGTPKTQARSSIEDRLKRAVNGTPGQTPRDTPASTPAPESSETKALSEAEPSEEDKPKAQDSKAEASKAEESKETVEPKETAEPKEPAKPSSEPASRSASKSASKPASKPIVSASKDEPKEQKAASSDPDFEVVKESIPEPPQFAMALAAARQLVLHLNKQSNNELKDMGLDLVEALEGYEKSSESFLSSVNDQLTGQYSKIKYLAAQRIKSLENTPGKIAKKEEQIALLMEEGQRLSHQELKLNNAIKKLRADKLQSEKRAETETKKTTALTAEIAKLKQKVNDQQAAQNANLESELEKTLSELELTRSRASAQASSLEQRVQVVENSKRELTSQLAEQRALVEHYRAMAETSTAAAATDQQVADLQRRLTTTQTNHQTASDNWNDIEVSLLRRVAELEQSVEHGLANLQAAQRRAHQAQDQVRQSQASAETATNDLSQVRAVAAEQRDQLADVQEQSRNLEEQVYGLEKQISELQALVADKDRQASEAKESWALREQELVQALQEEPMGGMGNHTLETMGSNVSLDNLEGVDDAAAMSGMDSSFAPPGEDVLSPPSMSILTSGGGPSFEHSHLVGKLSLTVRKLEDELASTKLSLERAQNDRDGAYAEMVKYMSAQEELATVKTSYENQSGKVEQLEGKLETLLVKLGEKTERVSELEADVQDLKEAYRSQIESLVDQLAGNKQ